MKTIIQRIRGKLQLCITSETDEEKLLIEIFQAQIGVEFEQNKEYRKRQLLCFDSTIPRKSTNTMLEIKPFLYGIIVREKLEECDVN